MAELPPGIVIPEEPLEAKAMFPKPAVMLTDPSAPLGTAAVYVAYPVFGAAATAVVFRNNVPARTIDTATAAVIIRRNTETPCTTHSQLHLSW